MRAAALVLAAACSSPGESPDAHVPTESGALGMNDVSILLPLPPNGATAVLATMTDGGDLVPRDLFARLVSTPGDVIATYEEFHLVAIRFDLCDRPAPGACPPGDDGRLRLVFQPMFESVPGTQDVALHAFYPIANAELGSLVDDLRRLAALGATPVDAPLRVSTAVASPAYAAELRALVMRYAGAAKLTRLTLFAQNAFTASLNWAFRGVEKKSGQFVDIQIPDLATPRQQTILTGQDTYDTMPVADAPAGFTLAISGQAFAAASPAARMQALEAMAAIQNPMTSSAEDTQCIGCHVTTLLTARRSATAGVDPAAIRGRYTAPYDLSITTESSTTNARSLRAFGYLITEAEISQRVVNDTAQVLVEIEARYPPAVP
jgi:hypothetical protein